MTTYEQIADVAAMLPRGAFKAVRAARPLHGHGDLYLTAWGRFWHGQALENAGVVASGLRGQYLTAVGIELRNVLTGRPKSVVRGSSLAECGGAATPAVAGHFPDDI